MKALTLLLIWWSLACWLPLACADGPPPDAPVPRASFVVPADGDTVPGELAVRIETEGIRLTPPGGDAEEGTGHLLLMVDAELPPIDRQIPMNDAEILHLDNGGGVITLRGLAPGQHRLIAALAGGDHRRIVDARADTVYIIVLQPR